MIGLIPKLLIDLVEKVGGEKAVCTVKTSATIPDERHYQIDQVYDDDEWKRLFQASCETLNLSLEQACDAYADFFLEDVKERFPVWFEISGTARELLECYHVIHNGFSSALADNGERTKITDKFEIESRNGIMIVHYPFPNNLCTLYCALEPYEEDDIAKLRMLVNFLLDSAHRRISITDSRPRKTDTVSVYIPARSLHKKWAGNSPLPVRV